jgi:hypothetical protein
MTPTTAAVLSADELQQLVRDLAPDHDHGGATAAITVAAGEVVEERPSLHGGPVGQTQRTGQVSVVPELHIHRVHHAGTAPAVSIHAYSPPLGDVGVYSEDGDGLIERRVQPGEHELGA